MKLTTKETEEKAKRVRHLLNAIFPEFSENVIVIVMCSKEDTLQLKNAIANNYGQILKGVPNA